MTIREPKGALEKIVGTGLWIELVPAKRDQNFDEYFKDVDIEILGEPLSYRDGRVRIQPVWQSSKHILKYAPDDAKLEKEIILPDFKNSDDLYKKTSGDNAKYKILYDRCSFLRSKELYEQIAQIEQNIRDKYLSEVGFENVPKPRKYRSKSSDHRAAQFDLFEMLSVELLKPASDKYFTSQIALGMTPLEARKLIRLDEYQIPLTEQELTRFRNVRNAVMHFRVVTNSDAKFIIDANSKMIQFHMMDIVYKSVNEDLKKANG